MRLSSFFVFLLLISSSAIAAFDEDQQKLENLLKTQEFPESVFEEVVLEEILPPPGIDRRPAIINAAEEVSGPEWMDSVSVSPVESQRSADDTSP